MNRNFLIIFDLNGTLICRVKSKLATNGPPPDFTVNKAKVFIRPYLQNIIDFATSNKQFKFAIWTSAEPKNANALVRKLFGKQLKFEFVYDRSHCSNAPMGVKSKKVSKNFQENFSKL